MGSGAWAGGAGASYANRTGHRDPDQPSAPEQGFESAAKELRSGQGYSSDDADWAPQYLVQADDPYDEEFSEGRLAAPPVLGEGPPGYGGF